MSLKYHIKKSIIENSFQKKKKKQPFNPTADELFQLKGDESWKKNNSYFFGGYSFENKEALVLRLGLRNLDYVEVFVFYKLGDKFLVTPKDYYKPNENPLTITCITPCKEWEVSFNGELMDKNDGSLHKVSFSFRFKERREIYDFFYSIQNVYMIEACAKAKWDKRFQEEMGGNDQRHYEQSGYVNGEIIIDGEKRELNLVGGRDHSFGERDWNYMNDHIWLYGFKDNGEIFNYSLVNYPLLKNIQSGYTDFDKDRLVSLRKAQITKYQANSGKATDIFKVDITLEDGQVLHVAAEREVNHETHYQSGDYYFQEGLGKIIVNGEEAYGSIEFGYNKNPERWEIQDEDL